MTYLGNPKADPRLCQIGESSLPGSQPRVVVHSESNALITQIFLVHLETNRVVHFKAKGALQSKEWCTSNQIPVHSKARKGAPASKFWCTVKQAMEPEMPRLF
jgi:hypothetical protein